MHGRICPMDNLPRSACSGIHFLTEHELFMKKPGLSRKTDKQLTKVLVFGAVNYFSNYL